MLTCIHTYMNTQGTQIGMYCTEAHNDTDVPSCFNIHMVMYVPPNWHPRKKEMACMNMIASVSKRKIVLTPTLPHRPQQLAMADAGVLKCPMCQNHLAIKPKVRWDMHGSSHGDT